MTVDIVAMQSAHIEMLMPYEREMFGTEAWTRAGYRAELADTRHRTYVVAVDDLGQLVGWAGVRVVADEAEILTVGVIPTARRQGIARRLVGQLIDVATGKGATAAYLEVRVDNEAAQRLYESEGFTTVGLRRGYYDAGRVDAVVMLREL